MELFTQVPYGRIIHAKLLRSNDFDQITHKDKKS